MKREIYLDHASTTYLIPEVERAMEPYWQKNYGNPSSLHKVGREAKVAIDGARQRVARILNCSISEIIFTGSGTESDNLAILGTARAFQAAGGAGGNKPHVITAKIEHHAVLDPCLQLEKEGFEVTYLPVGKDGLVEPKSVEKAIRPETVLVSVMYANNEIGTIQPIAEISKIIGNFREESRIRNKELRKENKPLIPNSLFMLPVFHTDACQAPGALPIDVKKMGVDLMTINGSKIYGPKGVGVLYKNADVKIRPLVFGGGQEMGLRSGTENVANIVGMARALEMAEKSRQKESKRLAALRDYFIKELMRRIPKVRFNGHPTRRLPNNVNVSILDIEGEAVILHLDELGICASTGSACTSGSLEPSHVILALGLGYEYAHGSLRFTLGKRSTKEDIDYVLKVLPGIAEKLRLMSPVKVKMRK